MTRSDWPSHVQFVVSVETAAGERDLLCGADHTGFRDNAPTVRLWTDEVTERAVRLLGRDRVEEAAVEALILAAEIAYEAHEEAPWFV